MSTKDNQDIKGTFSLKIINKFGRVVERYTAENLVVNTGRNGAARLLGGDGTGKNITQIAFGTSNTAAAPADSDLTGKFIKAIDSVSYPQVGAVQFSWALDFAENNGMQIREFGLFNAANELFSRKVRSLIAKTVDIRIEGTWTIQF
jgi:hypothetical protein